MLIHGYVILYISFYIVNIRLYMLTAINIKTRSTVSLKTFFNIIKLHLRQLN